MRKRAIKNIQMTLAFTLTSTVVLLYLTRKPM